MTLHYLDFDYSEDAQGVGSFEAMAATTAEQAPRVQAEVVRADRAFDQFGACAPLGGGEWTTTWWASWIPASPRP
jgi:hypothetical protein